MAMAGGAKVEVFAFGEANFEPGKDLIHFKHFEREGVMKRPSRGSLESGFFTVRTKGTLNHE